MEDSFEITKRLNQLRMSVGLSKIQSQQPGEDKDEELEEPNYVTAPKTRTLPTEEDGRRSTERGLSRYLGLYPDDKSADLDPIKEESTVAYQNKQLNNSIEKRNNGLQNAYSLGPSPSERHLKSTGSINKEDNALGYSDLQLDNQRNIRNKSLLSEYTSGSPSRSYTNYSRKSLSAQKSNMKDINTEHRVRRVDKSFESIKQDVDDVHEEIKRSLRGDKSPELIAKYRDAATPINYKTLSQSNR